MKKFLGVLMTGALVLGLAASSGFAADAKLGAFKVKTGEGKEFKVDFKEAMLKGDALFIIMQTACNQCRTELDEVAANADAIGKKAEVFVVLVDMNEERGIKYLQEKGYKFPILLDPTFTIGGQVGLDATPSTLAVKKDGTVKFKKTGYKPGDVEKLIDQL